MDKAATRASRESPKYVRELADILDSHAQNRTKGRGVNPKKVDMTLGCKGHKRQAGWLVILKALLTRRSP